MSARNQSNDLDTESQIAPGVRSRPKKFVPTARLTVMKQLEILRGFAVTYQTTKEPVSNHQVGKVANVQPSTVAMTNFFFKSLGLLFGKGNSFTPSDETTAFSSAFQWDPSTSAHKLRPRFEDAWFAVAISTHLRMRPITIRDAIRILAEDSGASKHYEDQLEMCLRFLEVVGLISISGDQITAPDQSATHSGTEKQPESAADLTAQSDPLLRVWPHPHEASSHPSVLFLDPAGERRIELYAPASVTKSELERIQQWLGFQLIVSEEGEL